MEQSLARTEPVGSQNSDFCSKGHERMEFVSRNLNDPYTSVRRNGRLAYILFNISNKLRIVIFSPPILSFRCSALSSNVSVLPFQAPALSWINGMLSLYVDLPGTFSSFKNVLGPMKPALTENWLIWQHSVSISEVHMCNSSLLGDFFSHNKCVFVDTIIHIMKVCNFFCLSLCWRCEYGVPSSKSIEEAKSLKHLRRRFSWIYIECIYIWNCKRNFCRNHGNWWCLKVRLCSVCGVSSGHLISFGDLSNEIWAQCRLGISGNAIANLNSVVLSQEDKSLFVIALWPLFADTIFNASCSQPSPIKSQR
jgi:hypothetical protein